MKRRSARPFMVEVKQTRTTRASLTAPRPEPRSSASLWQDLLEAEAKPSQLDLQAAPAVPAARPEEPPAQAPARRVLPSLLPMFEVSEPEPAPATEAEPAAKPRMRRPRNRAEQAPEGAAAASPAPKPVARTHRAEPQPAPDTASDIAEEPAGPGPAAGQAPSPRTAGSWRRGGELRLGERWKRRLPQYCR